MTLLTEVKVPDVGDVADIDVIEVLVQVGDVVAVEQTLAKEGQDLCNRTPMGGCFDGRILRCGMIGWDNTVYCIRKTAICHRFDSKPILYAS